MSERPKTRLDPDARREAILDVAQEVFLEEGFEGASMSTIAARLGGSKGTLYNYFKSKDELFQAYVERRCLWHQEVGYAREPHETVTDALRRIGRAYLKHVIGDDQTIGNFRLIVAESPRSPEIGRLFYETGPRRGVERLSRMLATMAAERDLVIDDPGTAAHQFLSLCNARLLKERLCNVIGGIDAAGVEAELDIAVPTFLRAYGPR